MTSANYTFGNYSVSMALDAAMPLGEIRDMRICHLGMKFTSTEPLTQFSVFEFDMVIRPSQSSGEPFQMKCCGIVVSCEPEDGAYRIVIHFSDLGTSDASCLEAITKASHMRCDYCENC